MTISYKVKASFIEKWLALWDVNINYFKVIGV
jgi:hypothetical protein